MTAVSLPAPSAAPAQAAPPAPSPATPETAAVKRRGLQIPLVSTRIAGKIIAPYLIIMLILALLAVYIVTRLVTDSINTKFIEKLQDSGAAANESMVKLETEFLQVLRLMTNTEGVAEALEAQDTTKLEELLLPLQVNAKMGLVDVFAPGGVQLLALRADEYRDRALQMTDPALAQHPIVQNALGGVTDNLGDKYAALMDLSWGKVVYASAPVRNTDQQIVGSIVIGYPLEKVLERLSKEAQVSLTIYDTNGKLVATTLPADDLGAAGAGNTAATQLEITPKQAEVAVGANPVLVSKPLALKQRAYTELVGALEIRTVPAAPMGVALPNVFIQQAAFASRIQIIAVFGIVVLGVLAMGLALARAITNPISKLVQATEIVATGNYEAEVTVSTSDEVGKLTQSFNHMVSGLREREKIRNMFSQFVTGAVAEAVLAGKVRLGGDRQDISVLISDVRSFTTLSESLDAPTLVALINRYFNLMIDAVVEFEGTLDKFLGDGIITEYNCPLEQERHELRAVLTALRMRDYLKVFNADQVQRGEKTIRIGIGIHSGSAVVGNIGAEGKKLEYTAMGDTVNCASRLESQTKEVNSDVVISSTTFDACKDFVDVGEPMALHVKGRNEPVIAHKLIRLKPGLTLSTDLISMPLEEVRRITAEHDDRGAGLYDAERANSYNPDEVLPPGAAQAAVAVAAG
ncbi:MAG TPA: adenylate/guanylate cyclase domain-containing protein [Chloroflexota bacterium]|nr:adenylate/guanylate cyclase domain-containing protein [Chloroflexota bacterium]